METKTRQHYVAPGCNPASLTEYIRWGQALGWEVAGTFTVGTTVTIIWKEVDPSAHPTGLPSFSNYLHR
jgi:hypothetical protein